MGRRFKKETTSDAAVVCADDVAAMYGLPVDRIQHFRRRLAAAKAVATKRSTTTVTPTSPRYPVGTRVQTKSNLIGAKVPAGSAGEVVDVTGGGPWDHVVRFGDGRTKRYGFYELEALPDLG